MNAEMRRISDDYVDRLHRAMRGATGDVIGEAEREIRAHIDDALAARSENTVGALLDVLDRLGPPEAYARDLGLYMMVEAGYYEWSLRHMFRSTVFWAVSTVVGAVVVLIFGVLYAAGLGMLIAAALRLLGAADIDAYMPAALAGLPPVVLVLGGVLLLVGLTAIVRWFVGQYVHSARPHTLGGREAGEGWVRRASRRILVTAFGGLAVTLVAGFGAGVYGGRTLAELAQPPDYLASPMALLSGLGMVVLLLSPVLGVLWTVLAERRIDATTAGAHIGLDTPGQSE